MLLKTIKSLNIETLKNRIYEGMRRYRKTLLSTIENENISKRLEKIELCSDEIQSYKEQIALLNIQINDKKNELNRLILSFPQTEFSREIYYYLYWGFPEINADFFNQSFGREKPCFELRIEFECLECGSTVIAHEPITSRSNLHYKFSSLGKYFDERCESCKQQEKFKNQQEIIQREKSRQERLQQLKTMPYRDYLQTEEWKDTRKRALKRAGFKCELCHSNEHLHVHHKLMSI